MTEPSPRSPEFSRRLADLMNATGVKAGRIERVLRGQTAAVRRTTIYNWLNGSSLPLSLESLLAVVHACADHAVRPAALPRDREWAELLAQVKQERDSRAGRSAQARHRHPGPGEPGPPLPPRWKPLHPAETADRLARLDRRDPDRAVAMMFEMEPGRDAREVLKRIDHECALGLLARVQPVWVAKCVAADDEGWFRGQLHQMSADRGTDVFDDLAWRFPDAAARTLSVIEPDKALRFLEAIDERHLKGVFKRMSWEHIDQLLDRMTPGRAAAALVAHADWAAYMLVIKMDRRRADAIVGQIGTARLSAVLGAAKADDLARLIKNMDRADAVDWLGRMEAADAARVLRSIGPKRIATLLRDLDLDRGQAALWLTQMEAADAARALELLEPADEAKFIGSLEPAQAARYLDKMSAAGAARMLASAGLHGLPRAAEILHEMDPQSAGPALEGMEPDQLVPLLKQAGAGFVDVMLAARARSMTFATTAQIIHAVCASPADLANLLARNPPAVAAWVAQALPVPEAADALALMDAYQAHEVLRLVPRVDGYPGARSLPYTKSAFERYSGQQIEILKAIERRDEAMGKRLTDLLGLAPPKPPRWRFALPENLGPGNTGPHTRH